MLTFADCQKRLARSRSGQKNLAKHTVLYKIDNHTYGVRYHHTIVVKIHDDDTWTLDSGGWMTVTTKSRINEYSPARISQADFVWYLNGKEFEDGCRVDANGAIVLKPAALPFAWVNEN